MSDFEMIGQIQALAGQGLMTQAAAQRLQAALRRPGVVAQIPGRTAANVETRKYCGLGVVQFTPAGALAAQLVANPQEPLGPARLVLVRNDFGATVPGLQVLVTNVTIGTVTFDIAPGEGVPVEMFAPDSLANLVQGIPLSPGVQIVVTLTCSAAPGAGELINVGGAMVGAGLS